MVLHGQRAVLTSTPRAFQSANMRIPCAESAEPRRAERAVDERHPSATATSGTPE